MPVLLSARFGNSARHILQYSESRRPTAKATPPPCSPRSRLARSTDVSGRTVLKLDPFGPTTQKLGKSSTYKLTVEGAADTDGLAVKDTSNNELAQNKSSSFNTKRR